MIKFTEPVQTSAGEPVEIITTQGRGQYPVVGYHGDSKTPWCWTKEGKKQHGFVSSDDLMNVPPKKKVMYLNMYDSSKGMLTTREEADRLAASVEDNTFKHRIACVRVEYTEGQFDE